MAKTNSLVVKRRATKTVVNFFRFLFLLGMCYLFLFPIFYMFSVAIADPSVANDPLSIWIPSKVSLYPFKIAVEVLDYYKSLFLTSRIAVFSTVFTLLSCSLAGYGISRFGFLGKRLVLVIVFLTIIVPPQVLLTSQYINFRYFDFGGLMKLLKPIIGTDSLYLLDSSWTFILPAMFANGLRGGLFIYIFKQFFDGLPKELEEAGRIDGCGTFGIFWKIMLPQAVPAIVTVLLFSFVWHWNDYYSSSVFFTSGTKPLQVMLNGFSVALSQGGYTIGGVEITKYEERMFTMAGALLTVLPPLIIYVIAQRKFTESVERSGIVG